MPECTKNVKGENVKHQGGEGGPLEEVDRTDATEITRQDELAI